MLREKIIDFIGEANTPLAISYTFLSIIIVYLSLIVLAYEQKFFPLGHLEATIIDYIDIGVLTFFTIDFLFRIIFLKKRVEYVFSFSGLIDILAILPSLLALYLPIPSSEWLRALRLTRFFRILQFFKPKTAPSTSFSLFTKLLPWIGIAAALKLAIVIWFEHKDFWIEGAILEVPISVIGFATAILLGAKLTTAFTRFYSIEDAISRIVGSLKGLCAKPNLRAITFKFANNFSCEIEAKEFSFKTSQDCFEKLAINADLENYDEAVICELSKDYQHVIHLLNSKTPAFFDLFMKLAAGIFVGMSILSVPGFTGLFTALVMVSIIGGMYVLIDDLDEPISKDHTSLINVDISSLKSHISKAETDKYNYL